MNIKTNNKGFTLIEMVIVIVIIAILAAILVPNLLAYVDRAQESNVLSAGKTIYECIGSEMADQYQGQDLPDDKDGFSDSFWEKVSKDAGTTVTADSIDFDIINRVIKNYKYYEDDKVAYINDEGAWVVDKADEVD